MRGSCMPSFSNYPDRKSICSGKAFPLVDPNFPKGKKRIDMGSEDRIHFWILQHPFLNHNFSAAPTFFGRLKNPFDVPFYLIFHRRKEFCYTQKDRHMGIVATGMHLPLDL